MAISPRHLNSEPLPTSFVSKDELKAITYVVTLKCEAQAFPETHRAHLVVRWDLNHSELCYRGHPLETDSGNC
jgi:hypothetical protein